MKKAASTQAISLGTKRTCPKCALKFYDMSKPEIQCPKCGTEVDPNAGTAPFKITPEKKKPKTVVPDDEEEVVVATSEFESVDDLGDDDDESLDNLAGDGDDEDA